MTGVRCPSALELVGAWERGLHQPPLERALTLLAAACTRSREELAALSIGRRDAELLALYELLFGPALDAFAECPECGERLEYSFNSGDLATHAQADQSATGLEAGQGEFLLRLRLPNSQDLSAVSGTTDLALARRTVAERCVVEALHGALVVSAQTLSDELLDLAASRLAEADPGADTQIDLTCSSCRHRWQVLFDVECFLWAKVNSLAKRLLREVHLLASAYGWSEREVLTLSSVRRRFYLEMVA